MKNYLLKFVDEELELHYQSQRNQKLQQPLFYSFMVVSLVINISSLINQIANKLDQIPLAAAGCITDIILLWVGIKYQKSLQYLQLFVNIIISLYQLSFDPSLSTCDEYFSYSFNLSIFFTIIVFTIDFYVGVLSVILGIISIQVLTAYKSQRIEYMNVFLGVAAIIQLIHALFKFDKTSRSQFLMNEKESLFLQQSRFFIQKPHFLVQINENTKQVNVTFMQGFQEIDYQRIGYCFGCFGRYFLRKCISQNTMTNLEEVLFNPKLQKLNQTHETKYGKLNLQVKISEYGYHDRFVVIIEGGTRDKLNEGRVSTKTLHLFANYFQNANNQFKNNRMIKFGMMSILLINAYQIKLVNITKLIKKLIKEFELENLIQFTSSKHPNKRSNDKSEIKIQTFYYQLQIFLVQVLQISQEISQNGEQLSYILLDFEDFIELQIKLRHNQNFLSLLSQNLFIQTLSDLLLFENININLSIKFRKDIQFSTKSIQIVTY